MPALTRTFAPILTMAASLAAIMPAPADSQPVVPARPTHTYADLADLAQLQRVERRFEPAISAQAAADRMCEWEHAVRQTLAP